MFAKVPHVIASGRSSVTQDAPADSNAFAQGLFEGLPDRYDLLVDMLTFGQNAR